jgi:subtilisin family serine protease
VSDPVRQAERDPDDWKKVRRFAVLDPAGEPPGSVFPTVYVADELLVDLKAADGDAIERLRSLAGQAGWTLEENGTLEDPLTDPEVREPIPRSRGAAVSVRVRLGVAEGRERVASTPDAWDLLRQARRDDFGWRGISLNHVLTTDSIGLNPFKANPFKANPFKANPFKANPFKANAATVGIDSYAVLGFGGLQPVTYLGPEPAWDQSVKTHPVVAIFDTGWGDHPWLDGGVVIPPYLSSGEPIGIRPDLPTDPEEHPSLAEPMDGIFDDAAGHGTFIAGIVRQGCPNALILPVRIADGEGVILENDLIGALGRLVELMGDTDLLTEHGGASIDVLNLSFSYYHESPDDPTPLSEMARLLDEIRAQGCVVVCSAGNEATARPTYPADIPAAQPDRQVSVGALNPSDHSVAMFSNIGDWVEVYAPGVSVLSTLPIDFDGGIQAGTRDDAYGHRRETLDADDFRGGFGVWSGTSFAAPVVAGRIAERILAGDSPETAKAAVVKQLWTDDHSRLH